MIKRVVQKTKKRKTEECRANMEMFNNNKKYILEEGK